MTVAPDAGLIKDTATFSEPVVTTMVLREERDPAAAPVGRLRDELMPARSLMVAAPVRTIGLATSSLAAWSPTCTT